MILVDSSVWVDHLRVGDAALEAALNANEVLAHPFVVGELALGHLRQRILVLRLLQALPSATMAQDAEVFAFIESQKLCGQRIGYIDAHLMASVRLTAGAVLWTRDKPLRATAQAIGLPLQ